jgi:hypothetical protein
LVVVLGFGRRASPVSPQPLFLVRPERERGKRSSVLGVFLDWPDWKRAEVESFRSHGELLSRGEPLRQQGLLQCEAR